MSAHTFTSQITALQAEYFKIELVNPKVLTLNIAHLVFGEFKITVS